MKMNICTLSKMSLIILVLSHKPEYENDFQLRKGLHVVKKDVHSRKKENCFVLSRK